MASGDDTTCLALKGVYSKLYQLGLSFSLAGELQSRRLSLNSSSFNSKKLNKKNKKKKSSSSSVVQHSKGEPKLSAAPPRTKVSNQALPGSLATATSKAVDLCSCSSVEYHVKEGVPGVSYTNDTGETGWTPVRQVRRGRRFRSNIHPSDCSEDGSDTETEDLIIAPNSKVTIQVRDNVPGLFEASPKIKIWTPIAARTRTQSRIQ
uniref:Uncharacterized protein n=1 Tax=Amphimedon queenslandica TaxID=400682 RepID=A0A1X7VH00_AMPQE